MAVLPVHASLRSARITDLNTQRLAARKEGYDSSETHIM